MVSLQLHQKETRGRPREIASRLVAHSAHPEDLNDSQH